MLPPQNALRDAGVDGLIGRLTALKVGKVVAVRRDSNTVDVAFMDGVLARNIPVLSPQLGSTWGFASVIGPSYDRDEPVRKTYPDPTGTAVHAPGNAVEDNRDQYVACLQFEGSRHGQTGLVAIGYVPPQVCEMFFPGGDNEFTDMVLYRTASDVQITIQRDGKMSVQHPSGARFTMGEGEMEVVSLEGQDFDKLYKIRQNKGKAVGFYIIDTAGTWVTWDHEGNLKAFAPKNIEVEAGIDIKAVAGSNIEATAGSNITAIAGSNVSVDAGLEVTVVAGTTLTLLATMAIEIISAGPISLTSPTVITLTAPSVLVVGAGQIFDEALAGGIGRQAV